MSKELYDINSNLELRKGEVTYYIYDADSNSGYTIEDLNIMLKILEEKVKEDG